MLLRTLHIADSFDAQTSTIAGSLLGLDCALRRLDIEPSYCVGNSRDHNHADYHVAQSSSLDTLAAEAALVHIHGWGTDFTRSAALCAIRHNKPYLISSLGCLVQHPLERESRISRWRSRLRDRRLINGAFCLTSINEAEHVELADRFPAKRIDTLSYGVDIDRFRSITPDSTSASLLPEGKTLLHFGPIHPQEGLVPLLKSFAELGLDARGWGVVLAGDDCDGWQAQLEAAVRRKGAVEQVTFVRSSSLATHRFLLSRASIFIATGLHFRCLATILQAVACEVPVLASKQLTPPGLEHEIRVCQPTRASIRPALGELMNNSEDQRKNMATSALCKAREVADWSACAQSWATLYEQVIQ